MFKMAAAAMFNSGYLAFIAIIDAAAGQNLKEQHQFFKIQDGGSRHVDFRLKDALRCNGSVVYRSRYIPTKFGETCYQIW